MNQHEQFSRKITAYFDGTLLESERTEFEAYVGTHADFASYFRQKEIEQNSLKARVPLWECDGETTEHLETEVREVIHHLFQDEEASVGRRFTDWLKERL